MGTKRFENCMQKMHFCAKFSFVFEMQSVYRRGGDGRPSAPPHLNPTLYRSYETFDRC